LKVLVADGSPTQRRIVVAMLKQIGFTDTAEAEDGKQALEQIQSGEQFDLLITDWNMPVMSGLELVQAVRSDDSFAKLPILMITTRNMKQDIMTALKAGVNNYVAKPFTAAVLKEKIAKVMS